MPATVVTVTVPVVVPAATTAVICDAELTVYEAASVPLNFTAVAAVRFVPEIVTFVPTTPAPGDTKVIVGGWTTVKLPLDVALPPGAVTETVPLVVPSATRAAVICVAESTLKLVAAVPWNVTAVAPERFAPVIVTVWPTGPVVGVKLEIVGAGIAAKLPLDVPVPPAR